jgi:hypothetical protein
MDRWQTREQIAEALDRFESAIPGWVRPRAHGLVSDGEIAVWNVGTHMLPAVVMAGVLRHDGNTAALPVSEAQLERAIELLTPAEACRHYDHPNLLAWRLATGRDTVAIFVR